MTRIVAVALLALAACQIVPAPKDPTPSPMDMPDDEKTGDEENPLNAAPVARIDTPATDVVVLTGASVSFSGTCTDAEDGTLTHTWSFGAGVTRTDADPGDIVLAPGVHTVTYSCSDADGGTSTAVSVVVTVNDPPVVQIDTPDTLINEGQTVDIQATCTDSDTPLVYEWQPSGVLVEDQGITLFDTPGVFTVTLHCTDALAGASSDSVVITVNDTPTATIDAPTMTTTVVEGDAVSFSGSCADTDASGAPTHAWDFDGATSTLEDPGAVTFATPGVHGVSYHCTDDRGATSPDATMIVNVNARPSGSIVAPASSVTINEGQSVAFSSTCSDPEVDEPFTHLWTFDGAAADATSAAPNVSFNVSGSYVIAYTCTDALGASDATPGTLTVTVNDTPVASIDDASEVTIGVGDSLSFAGTCTDTDGPGALTHAWTFDALLPTANVEDPGAQTFTAPGDFSVAYTCTDALGAFQTVTKLVHVRATHRIGGRVSGYVGSGLELQIDGGDTLAIARSEDFTFSTPVREGITYVVTVSSAPTSPAQVCDVFNGFDTVTTADRHNILVYCHAGAPFHVTPTGTGDGSSWANAAGIGQLSAMAAGQVAWVQAGVYRNALATPATTPVADVPAGRAIYGGFAGTETGFNERANAAPSILDGDVDDDDVADATDTHPVVSLSDRAEIEGFTVREGNAQGAASEGLGGGARVVFGSTGTFSNVTFLRNRALAGAAIEVQGSSHATILGCKFIGNVATQASGNSGAVYAGSASLTIADSLFYKNQADVGGAVHYMRFSAPSVLNVRRTAFVQNSALTSGAMRIDGGDAFLDENVFVGNRATNAGSGSGGALELVSGFSTSRAVHINEALFTGNSAARGGAIEIADVEVFARDVVFTRNTATSSGGALHGTSRAFYGSQVSAADNTATNGALGQGLITVALSRSAVYHAGATSWGTQTHSSCDDTCIESKKDSNNSDGVLTILDDSSAPLGDPFFRADDGHLYLQQASAGDAYTSACVDSGTAIPTETTWKTTTTRRDFVLDAPQLDRGAHVRPNANVLFAAVVNNTDGTVAWFVSAANQCWLYNDFDDTEVSIPTNGFIAHGKPPGTVLSIVCSGGDGAPAAVVLPTN